MSRAGWTLAGLLLVALLWTIVTWRILNTQGWLAVHTGTDYCVNLPARYLPVCRYYGFFSGFGSDLGEVVIITGIVAWYRKHECHEPGCWRLAAVSVDDHGTLSCWRHHPGGKPTPGHVARAHARHCAKVEAMIHAASHAGPGGAGHVQDDPGSAAGQPGARLAGGDGACAGEGAG